jgi:dCTP deaminase
MILSNVAIHRAIDDGALVIRPEPLPRLNSLTGPSSPYDTTSVNLRLGHSLNVGDETKPFVFDLRKPGLASFLKSAYRPVTIDREGGYSLEPKVFVLGNTLEQIELPIRPGHRCLAARVEGKSSFARCGLLIHFTAPTIHAGFSGTITFEIMNLGPQPIMLFPEMKICQLIFEWVDGEPLQSDGQFHGQTTPAGTSS